MTPPPQQRKNPPPAKKHNTTVNNNIVGSLIDGITFGAGSSIGHSIVNKMSSYFSHSNDNNCSELLKKLEECKKINSDCSELLSEYEKC